MRTLKFISKFKTPSILLILCMLLCRTLYADTGGSIYVAGVSKYLWRGQVLYRTGALQPGLDLSYKKLSISLWASYGMADHLSDSTSAQFGESDFVIDFSDSISILGFSLGYSYYTFPAFTSSSVSSEYYLGLSLDLFFSPNITLYWDVADKNFGGGDGLYAELALSCPFILGIEFALDASLGYNAGQWQYRASPTVLGLNLGTTFSKGPIDITPSVFAQIALDDQYKNGTKTLDGYASIAVAYNF